ncbi:MAG: hypothetical protein CSB19_01060 [Clostridiales bacterium]|nr:MAG: hypothetical protein CSB19_01060 [Clostridiales bacterium]
MDLINKLANPANLSVGDKISGGLMVAVVGMTITFLALIFLWLVIEIMSKILGQKKAAPQAQAAAKATPVPAPAAKEAVGAAAPKAEVEDEELIAVITAALSATLQTNRIVVSKIVRVADDRPIWAKTGMSEQMNSRL